MNSRAVLIFAKEPRAGRAKTRMTPPWSPAEASELALCFIRDTRASVSQVQGAECYLFFTPEESRPFFEALSPPGFVLVPQQGCDLTARCAHSVLDAFRRGHREVVQIGTDTPQIRSGHIEAAFDLLRECPVGLGPARDGGYYLLALSEPATGIYDGVVMGTDRVFGGMSENARRLGLKIRTLPEWVDGDTHEDLLLLAGDGSLTLGDATREFLGEKRRQYPDRFA